VCGRFTLHTPRDILARRFQVDLDNLAELAPRYNVAPTQPVPAVRIGFDGGRRAEPMRWGLIPHWTKQQSELPSMINARSETAARMRAYRHSFAQQRCLILADGFYEWRSPALARGPKQPYWISLASGEPFAFAGLWARWKRTDDLFLTDDVRSCAILTTAANEAVAPIHDRMPVILHPEAESSWIDPGLDDQTDRLSELLVPIPPEALAVRPVSRRVNSARNDGPDLIVEEDDARAGF
jgi:putative SOS response-associated peptidase YedK